MGPTSDTHGQRANSEALGLSRPELVEFDLVSLNFSETHLSFIELLLDVVKVGYE